MLIRFEDEIYCWSARMQDWYSVALPELGAQIRESPRPHRGFGSVRVHAQIGGSNWRTSIFPDAARGSYVPTVRRTARDAEGIGLDGVVSVQLEALGG